MAVPCVFLISVTKRGAGLAANQVEHRAFAPNAGNGRSWPWLTLEVGPESCRWSIQRICFCRLKSTTSNSHNQPNAVIPAFLQQQAFCPDYYYKYG
jgi:hypothetical protein